jgi:hypothetical protein
MVLGLARTGSAANKAYRESGSAANEIHEAANRFLKSCGLGLAALPKSLDPKGKAMQRMGTALVFPLGNSI